MADYPSEPLLNAFRVDLRYSGKLVYCCVVLVNDGKSNKLLLWELYAGSQRLSGVWYVPYLWSGEVFRSNGSAGSDGLMQDGSVVTWGKVLKLPKVLIGYAGRSVLYTVMGCSEDGSVVTWGEVLKRLMVLTSNGGCCSVFLVQLSRGVLNVCGK